MGQNTSLGSIFISLTKVLYVYLLQLASSARILTTWSGFGLMLSFLYNIEIAVSFSYRVDWPSGAGGFKFLNEFRPVN
ncbi:hypothetical protein C2G38_2178773 [Gigaspora rosea]|uniref:Uncharacterized protein n=1 Tax=Gigaspora rosea TaxID=44941 RepID=A0A397VN95_9GLOM|nr:hypothetical protein C2G38_2178773 [Gigaspora rosea]